MKIPWKIKSSIFKFIDILNKDSILYLIQKYITRRSKINLENVYNDSYFHIQKLNKSKKLKLLEFGAGKNLAQNIILSQFCQQQCVVDLKPMADLSQINEAALEISKIEKKVNYKKIKDFLDLEKNFGIKYLAPFDLRSSNFKNSTFDYCISTNTLEHISKEDIISIFHEVKRICKKGGSILAYIDYSDHYSHTDKSISNLNFLKFSSQEWLKHNHNCHFQNRLRHHDFIKLFKDLDLKIKSEKSFFINQKYNFKISIEFDPKIKTTYATSGFFELII
jgi:hypothetical protein